MATAREEAIEAMCEAVGQHRNNLGAGRYVTALDAIPDDVLVRLAKERGVLEPYDGFSVGSEVLYRVVTP